MHYVLVASDRLNDEYHGQIIGVFRFWSDAVGWARGVISGDIQPPALGDMSTANIAIEIQIWDNETLTDADQLENY